MCYVMLVSVRLVKERERGRECGEGKDIIMVEGRERVVMCFVVICSSRWM